jgi:hypothetical protein
MKSIIVAILAFVAAASHAGEWGLQVHGHSHHFNARAFDLPWNETNFGLAIRYSFDTDLSVQAGRYLNSYSLPGYDAYTNYAAVDYTPWHYKALSFGGYAGIGNGYDEPYYYIVNGRADVVRVKEQPISASGGAIVRFDYSRFNITVRVNPAMAEVEYGVKF